MIQDSFIEQLKNSGLYIYVACTGAGAGLQKIIADEPGISNVFVGSEFPYKKHMTDAFLGFEPDKYVSEETAINMAMESFVRAKTVAYKEGKWDQKCIGLGLTASIASEKVHRGEHQIHIATISDRGIILSHVILEKGSGKAARREDGLLADSQALLELEFQLSKGDSTWHNAFGWPENLEKAFYDRPVFTINRRLKESSNSIKFPGNFNPPHAGHFDMARRSSASLKGGKVDFLINIDNPHKPHISIIECLCRVAAFRASEEFNNSSNAIHFTKGQPLFVDKVRAYPTCKFIIGADTLARILDPKWGPSTKEVLDAIPKYALLFFNRKEGNQTITLQDIPEISYIKLENILGDTLPISSSQIREERNKAKIQQDDLWPVP